MGIDEAKKYINNLDIDTKLDVVKELGKTKSDENIILLFYVVSNEKEEWDVKDKATSILISIGKSIGKDKLFSKVKKINKNDRNIKYILDNLKS